MKRIALAAVLVTAFVLATTAVAYADHSPTFYVEWNQTSNFTGYGGTTFGNQGTGSPHQGYLEGTEKCAVCHSVHRAPVPHIRWDTNPADPAAKTAVAGGQYNRLEFESDSANTEMLLIDSVANSCNYCHVYTSIGNKQLYAGKMEYINSEDAFGTDEWDAGFGHHNGCTGCHAVHGVSSNFGSPALYGATGVFRGPVATKVLKVRAKGSGGAGAAAYVWQDEVITAGSAGKVEAQLLYGLTWANKLTPNDTAVDPQNVPLFPTATDAILGTNARPDVDAGDAQVSAFCTFCHQNYGYASEATVNPDGDRSLFQGPWYALAGTVPNVTGTPGTWVTANGSGAYGMPFKNHPLKNCDALPFAAAGKGANVPAQVAFVDSGTCRSCHDAGLKNQVGVIVQSWPHFTPGYFHFVKSAAHVGASMTNAPPIPDVINSNNTALITATQVWLDNPTSYEEAVTVSDGQCLKCHVNSTDDAGVGKTY
ncbi:MAG TPA: hypothetical protein VFG89_04005 [Coriobacteriia bacterium]|nr:hypothetical protein [Coriobacteriia bacterium]